MTGPALARGPMIPSQLDAARAVTRRAAGICDGAWFRVRAGPLVRIASLLGRWGREAGDLVRRRAGSGDELGLLRGYDRGPDLRVGRPRHHRRLPPPHRGPD